MAKIAVIGTGYVGLVSGACLADFGNVVICVDNNADKIETLKNGKIPIYEPGLDDVVNRTVETGRLSFTTDMAEAIQKSDVIFIAVGTPPAENGSADLKYVEEVARSIARTMNGYKVVVNKSTVPIGTGKRVQEWISEELENRGKEANLYLFDIVSNPEFLREGSAVRDFMHPDRVVIGTKSEKARSIMKDVYRSLYINETPFIETNIETAEMIKYASNSFLAVKITFINEVANLCEKVGADVQDVAKAMGRDGRIGGKFLHPGPGYGGSCFPKDTQAMARIGREAGMPLTIVETTIQANESQKLRMFEKIESGLGGMGHLTDKIIAVLGLSFKPNTDDMREAPAIEILTNIARRGAIIRACDPAAIDEAQWRLKRIKDAITYYTDEYEAVKDADAVIIMTEWNQYRNLDLDRIKSLLKTPIFFDLRNVYKRADMEKKGFIYYGVGQ
ncbi:UDP-glucose/GDP-mannose dehydrogenase family protein [Brucepastera parasyntrophica]|uniref:UDP-glucose dehydrogenase family protein n=1 Tax=Brucepastera parasyntrophica TaxID=2880008 RepID=UPI002108BCB2|nr:UDP-glucose/GDP-mannose dehydrogenase family protein [Brucepastera parasyntrophica]ULQ60039.1 UDP-glucose/GDP-mannose dehydrogenase family protein [Brucepastera parasyntrophica]